MSQSIIVLYCTLRRTVKYVHVDLFTMQSVTTEPQCLSVVEDKEEAAIRALSFT